MNKTCGRCGVEQPIDNFGFHKRDGRQSWCRNCKREKANEYYARNPEKFKARQMARPAEVKTAISARSRKRNRDAINARTREYFQQQPAEWHHRRYLLEKARTGCACNHVNGRIRRGDMERLPCEVCGASVDVQGHHDDYNQPFVVRFLCATHHAEWHKLNEPVWLVGWEESYARMLAEDGLSDPTVARPIEP